MADCATSSVGVGLIVIADGVVVVDVDVVCGRVWSWRMSVWLRGGTAGVAVKVYRPCVVSGVATMVVFEEVVRVNLSASMLMVWPSLMRAPRIE